MKNKDKLVKILIILLLLSSVLIKGLYIHNTGTWERQHDVIGFGAGEGHAGYIEYIYNNKALPDMDPRSLWAFFQPPLHHIICAVFLMIFDAVGMNSGKAQESLQIITMIYMILVTLTGIGIYKELFSRNKTSEAENSGKTAFMNGGLLVALSVFSVHPIFTLMSGSINNDGLSLVLAVLALYFAIRWYENPSIKRIIPVALFIGFSMMAKLTGGLVAVPVAVLMLIRFFEGVIDARDKKAIKDTKLLTVIIQYVIFGIIVFPIGLWWSIRNIIKWNMPVNYIPPVGEQLPENITLLQRLFDFRMVSVYPSIEGKNADFSEFNVNVALIKTSLFGEWDFSEFSGKLTLISWMLFILAVILIVLCIIATVYMTFSKNSQLTLSGRIVLSGTWITYLLAYLSFALGYRNFSAEDFRYGAICILMEGLLLGLFYENISQKVLKYIIFVTSTGFALLSLMVYLVIGIRA